MDELDQYKVDLKSILAETVTYQWQVGDDFFSAVQGTEIQHGQLTVTLKARRTAGKYALQFQLVGTVDVECDRCMERMAQPINTMSTLDVKMGEAYEDDGDLITIPADEGTLNVAWHIYEIAALEIPIRHVHPEGECPIALTTSRTEETEAEETKETDPRWNALKSLLDNNNKK